MNLDRLMAPMDSALWEMGEAFADFPQADLWRRADPRLLSVGELGVHVAFGEIRWLFPELASPLNLEAAGYYPDIVGAPFALDLGPEALYEEIKRVHEAVKTRLGELNPDMSAALPTRSDWTWGYALEYMAFHIAYHTGQMYSVRHLLGHETPHN